MIYSFCHRTSYVIPRVDHALHALLFLTLSFAAVPATAQQPSNVYRPPADNFNQQPVQTYQQGQGQNYQQGLNYRQGQTYQPGQTYQQEQTYQQGQNYQSAPQYQTVPGTQQYTYPQQNQTPVYQQPFQEVPGQLVPQQAPAQSGSENVELKRSLVKARDLMEKYQIKLEDVTRRNQELENQITNLQQSGDMGNSDASRELVAAKATAAEAQEQMSGLNNQLQNALRDLQTSTGDLDRQKQMGAELQQQIASLQKSAQMAAGSDEQVAELTRNIQQFKAQNDELNGKVNTLQNALRDKDTQIASMGSNDDTKLTDLRELLEESETNNKDLSSRLKTAQAEMSAPQADPALDQLRADNQQLGQQNQQLESQNSQLNDMIQRVQSENSQLGATVTRLQNMPAPVVEAASGFAAAAPAVAPSADLTGLQNQLASVTRKNKLLERKVKLSKSEYASLTEENARLLEGADVDSSIEVAPAPVMSVKSEVAALPVAVPELGLDSVSGGWPVKYWIFGMLGVGLLVGLGVAWYESIVGPTGTGTRTSMASGQQRNAPKAAPRTDPRIDRNGPRTDPRSS